MTPLSYVLLLSSFRFNFCFTGPNSKEIPAVIRVQENRFVRHPVGVRDEQIQGRVVRVAGHGKREPANRFPLRDGHASPIRPFSV